jgi:hypothetical protein
MSQLQSRAVKNKLRLLSELNFVEKDHSTEVNVTHTNLPSDEEAKNHNNGWTSSLESFKNYIG